MCVLYINLTRLQPAGFSVSQIITPSCLSLSALWISVDQKHGLFLSRSGHSGSAPNRCSITLMSSSIHLSVCCVHCVVLLITLPLCVSRPESADSPIHTFTVSIRFLSAVCVYIHPPQPGLIIIRNPLCFLLVPQRDKRFWVRWVLIHLRNSYFTVSRFCLEGKLHPEAYETSWFCSWGLEILTSSSFPGI